MLERNADPERVFDRHYNISSRWFWNRYGGEPDLTGKDVLDFGCGTGGMLHRLLKAGARKATGIDLSTRATDYARVRLAQEWGNQVTVLCEDVRTASIAPVDLIVSQNTLEHVMPLEETILSVVGLCKPGGDIYFSFSPLWYSPYGHHNYPPTKVPWLHLLRGDQVVLDSFERIAHRHYADAYQAGFNKKQPKDFYALFRSLPVEILSLKINETEGTAKNLVMGFARAIAKVPSLERYVTVGISVRLRKL